MTGSRYSVIILTLIVVGAVGLMAFSKHFAQRDGYNAPLPINPGPGKFEYTVQSGGLTRRAAVFVPKSYKSGSHPPLVLFLHGAGGSGAGGLDQDGWAPLAEKEGFIAVAPDGLGVFPRLPARFGTNPAVWNSGQLKPGSRRAAIDDVAFIRELLDELKKKLPYDETRVFCTGHSNGGAMTFVLANEMPERFAAIGTVAGKISIDHPSPAKPLPTLYILGTKDLLMPMNGGTVNMPWGGTRVNEPIAHDLAKWATAIGCNSVPRTVSDKNDVKTVLYSSKNGGPTLTALYLTGHGHHWPGGKQNLPERLVGPNISRVDAAEVIWNFFKTCRL